MPIYEFHCDECEKDSELLVRSINWQDSTKCPHCGSPKLSKKFSTFASANVGASGNPAQSCVKHTCCGGGPHRH